ncbi:MAG: MFS transporter [Solirubrobacterales bacterium]
MICPRYVRVLKRISRIAVDLRPLRESRDFRLLTAGSLITGLGTQATLVALPYQVFVTTDSVFLTGLLGAAELVPLAAGSLYGGALADRFDRRTLLLACQLALVAVAAALALAAAAGSPPVWLIFILAAAIAGASAVERVVRAAIVPNTVRPEHLRGALSLTYGLYQLTQVAGPGVGGLLIAGFGVAVPYGLDSVSCLGMAAAAAAMSAQPPHQATEHEPVLRSIRSGLSFVRRVKAVTAGFVIDLSAMTFGMPRALFPVLSLTVFHAGAAGTGLLFASVAAGSTVAALTTGWLLTARYLGRIVLVAVAAWGACIAIAGTLGSLWPAAALFALAGAADSISAVCRSTIAQTLTPDRMRGRMTSVFSLVVAGGPRLGDIESGSVAALTSPIFSVVSGGLACLASVGLIAALFPQLAAYDGDLVGAGEVGAPDPEPEAVGATAPS